MRATHLLAVLLLATMLATFTAVGADFSLVDVTQYSSAGTHKVYPGSSNARLIVQVRYEGGSSTSGVYACITLPSGFTLDVRCSPAYTPGGDVKDVVKPGSIIEFRFVFDVARSVPPGSYDATLSINYMVNGSKYSEKLYIKNAVRVYEYPSIVLNIVDVWWEPGAYPGSSKVTLRVLIENDGEVRVTGLRYRFELPQGFRAVNVRGEYGPIDVKDQALLSLDGVSVDPRLKPGAYWVRLRLDARAVTEDGVEYRSVVIHSFTVSIAPPPDTIIRVADYGLAGVACPGSRDATFYVTLVNNDPDSTIEAVEANVSILGGGRFSNNTRRAYLHVTGNIGYGEYITLRVAGVQVDEWVVSFNTTMLILVSRNGAEYWLQWNKVFVVKLDKWCRVNVTLATLSSPQQLYPGSSAHLQLVLTNNDHRDLVVTNVTVILPSGFMPKRLVWSGNVRVASGSSTRIDTGIVDVGLPIKPGAYPLRIEVHGFVYDGSSFAPVTLQATTMIEVVNPPRGVLEVVAHYPSVIYTPCVDCSFTLYMRVRKSIRIDYMVVNVTVPYGASIGGSRSVAYVFRGVEYGDVIEVRLDTLSIYTSNPLRIAVTVSALVDVHGAKAWVNETHVIIVPVARYVANFTLVKVLATAPAYSSGGRLYIVLRNMDEDVVREVLVEVELENAVFSDSSKTYIETYTGRLGYGATLTITTKPILKLPSTLTVRIHVSMVYEDATGGLHPVTKTYTVRVNPETLPGILILEGVRLLYNGRPAVLLPGQLGIELHVDLLNPTNLQVTSLYASLEAEGINVTNVSGSCLTGVSPGSLCTLVLTLNTSTILKPGWHRAVLNVRYVVRSGDGILAVKQSFPLKLYVASPESIKPKLRVISVYTSAVQRPLRTLLQVNVIVVNEGRYPAYSVVVKPKVEGGVGIALQDSVCSETLQPASSCIATLRIYLTKPVSQVNITLDVHYVYQSYGVIGSGVVRFRERLRLVEFETRGLLLVDYRWANDWPVYPNTSNAQYQVTLLNSWPVTIRRVMLKLVTPSGFNASQAVIDALQPYSSTTATLRVNVGDVASGVYNATLIVTYVLEGVEGYTLVKEEYPVTLKVHNPGDDVKLVRVEWLGGMPEPGTIGAQLRVTLWNRGVPVIEGAVVKLYLPPGLRASINNATAVVSPATGGATPVAQPQQLPPELRQLAAILGGGGGAATVTGVQRGGFITAVFTINVYSPRPGVYPVKLGVAFVDQWGSVHTVYYTTKLYVNGSSRVIEVSLKGPLRVNQGTARTKLIVVNRGSAPVYNVYISLVPRIPILVPTKSIYYVDRLKPGEPVELNVTLVYNPSALSYWGGEAGSYSPLVYTVGVVYRDVQGYLHTFNTSVSTLVEPFIVLRLDPNTKAERTATGIAVQGTVYNLGISRARSVVAYAEANGVQGFSLIGDIDPGDQSAFRIDLPNVHSEYVNLTIAYRDDYGAVHRITRVLKVGASLGEVESNETRVAARHVEGIEEMIPALLGVSVATAVLVYLVFKRRLRSI